MSLFSGTSVRLLTAILSFVAICRLTAQISFGPLGTGPLTFDTHPPVAEWSTYAVAGSAGDIGNQTAMDQQVQLLAASQIVTPLVSSTIPSSLQIGFWLSETGSLATRPTGRFTMLMARLRNDMGTSISSLYLSYDLSVQTVTADQVPGYSFYYSLTGATGTWQRVSGLGGTNAPLAPKAAEVIVGNWEPNAPLYLLWTDDNGSGVPDTLLQVDNVKVVPAAPTLASQLTDRSVAPGGNTFFVADANGAPPLFYQWRKEGVALTGATNRDFMIANAQAGDQGSYSVAVSNAFGLVVSSNAFLTVACEALAAFTEQPEEQYVGSGETFTLRADATGTDPITFRWYRNGTLASTNRVYVQTNATPNHSGVYFMVASNCAGSVVSDVVRVGVSDPPYVVAGLTNHLWRYDQSDVDLGTAWRGTNYNDSGWAQGRGLFGFENNPIVSALTNTVLRLDNSNSTWILTYYFRTQFVLNNVPSDVMLVSSNYFDDGAIVYVNGSEAFRYNMPGGLIEHGDLALSANPAGEGVFVVSNLPTALLRQGVNTLAVQVHQNSSASPDVAFGMNLVVVPLPPMPLSFTTQPLDAVVDEGKDALFQAVVSGSNARFQWYKDGAELAGANGPVLSIPNVSLANAGVYLCRASNVLGVVYSHPASLTVLRDSAPPVLISADLLDSTHVLGRFSEAVESNSIAVLNFRVTNTMGPVAAIFSVVLTNQTNVLLTTAPLNPAVNHVLTALQIADTSPAHNSSLRSAVPIAREITLVGFENFWSYYDPLVPFEDADPGPTWRDAGHDLSNWGASQAGFWASEDLNFVPPVPVHTQLPILSTYSAYFRAPFMAQFSRGGLTLSLRHAVGDGAVFYLNGHEISRINILPDVPTPQTPAASGILTPAVSSSIGCPIDSFRAGTNILAAELHQWIRYDPERFFAAELRARVESFLTGPLLVLGGPQNVMAEEGGPATFRVSSIAASYFQWQMNGTNLPGATNSTLTLSSVPLAWSGAQLRCLSGNSNASMFSTNARLTVIADTEPPTLLAAMMLGSNAIRVSFSEPLSPASVTNVMNYTLTNSSGATTIIQSAALENGTNVILTLSDPAMGLLTLVVNHVTDVAAIPNPIAEGSAVQIGAEYFIALDSVWKYLLINTNDTVHSTFMLPEYDDSAWPSGQGLLYVEDATLPGPKNTPLSMFDETGTNRIHTHYFRQAFHAAAVGTNATVRVRHVIDDGLVLHLNGNELFRFNMNAGVVSATTPAPASIGNATLIEPSPFPTAFLLGGTNVLAASVHQTASVNADIVFGAQISISIPSVVLPPVEKVKLNLSRYGQQFLIYWDRRDYRLEQAYDVNGPWTLASEGSPAFVPRTNAAAFYRLRVGQ